MALLVILMIVGLLGTFFALRALNSSGTLVQNENRALAQLSLAQDSLLGFAAANGRLPCPASAVSNSGAESFCTNPLPAGCGAPVLVPPNVAPAHGRCTNPWDGFLPGLVLGLPGNDPNGFVRDPWAGRIRYAVTTANAGNEYAATRTDGIKGLTTAVFAPDLRVCLSATGIAPPTCGTAQALTPNNAVAVIFSSGRNGSTAVGLDEAANDVTSNDQVFISHSRTDSTAANGEFDDLVAWVTPAVLYARMTQAGRLP